MGLYTLLRMDTCPTAPEAGLDLSRAKVTCLISMLMAGVGKRRWSE